MDEMTERYPPMNAVKAFESVSRWGSMARASEELGVTPSAVSHQVRALELWFGLVFPFTDALFGFSMLFVLHNFLPIPPLDGSRIFFASRSLYVYALAVELSYIILVSVGRVYSYVWSILIGAVIVAVYWWFYEA